MANLVKPLGNTVRVLEWEELPASVREVPESFNPMDEGVLMRHQVESLKIRTSIKCISKGRRTGMTFAEALDSTLTASSRKSAGGDNIFYIGDTKEKGLEFIGYCAKFSRVIAEAQGAGVSSIEEFLFEDQDEEGNTKHITSYRIRFSSGFQITALSSRPANIRGLQGIVIIDEAAFHNDVQAVLDAATALLIWGGRIIVISTHNGKNNAFNQFIKDIEKGRYGEDAVVYTATFDDAVANGLYERVCLMKGTEPTELGKKQWYANIRNAYGPRKSAMREELDAIPRDGSGVCIPGVWIEQAMQQERPVLRLVLDDEFTATPPLEREAYVHDWIIRYLHPLILENRENFGHLRHVLGQDYARHRDFSTIDPATIMPNLALRVPFGIEMHNVPAQQQMQILWHLIAGLPRFSGAAMDATGTGETVAEFTADKFGQHFIHQIKLTRLWYGTWTPKLVDLFESEYIDLPRDEALASDIRCIEEVDGIPMVVKARKKDVKDPELFRHGDHGVALILMRYASLNMASEIDFESTGPRDSMRGFEEDTRPRVAIDNGFGVVGGTQDFGGY